MLKKNIFYQVFYQIVVLVVPLVLSKYITGIMSSETLGTYNFSFSIANYFVILGMLGIQKYGTRLISQSKNNDYVLRKAFWELFTLHLIISIISILSFILVVFFSNFDSKNIFWIQCIYVCSVLFDITRLFYGLENFKSIVIKNTFVKLSEVLLIIMFVKTDSDLWIYTLIMSISICFGQIVMLPQAIRTVKPIRVHLSSLVKHFKPVLILSISVISVSIYGVLDKTILGLLSPNSFSDVAIYEYSDKLIRIPLNIIAAIETVMLPRMSVLSANNDVNKFRKTISGSFSLINMISIGSMFGIISIANSFVSLWYGADYSKCKDIILYLSPIIFICSFGDVIRSQYLIPQKKDKGFTISLIVGALLNLVLNVIFIPIFGIIGAVIGTVSTELMICIIQLFIAKKDLPIGDYIKNSIPFFGFGIILLFLNYGIEKCLGIRYATLLLQILFGMLLYLGLSILYIRLFDKELFIRIFSKKK